jgi:glycosyltransferase involved in cell wall biosynthesis
MNKPRISTQKNRAGNVSQPNICLAMPLYNQTKFLIEALQSLLSQTYTDFRLLIVDDSTESEPGKIVRRFALKDRRIIYIKNDFRKGMVENWKACFYHAEPVDYFAWVSDHDVWHPKWLESMVGILNANSNAVLVYPKTGLFAAANGHRIIMKRSQSFSTDGLTDAQRVAAVCRDADYFGKKVYGLFRSDALRKAGVFRRVLFPDIVLLHELSLFGDFKQVDAELMYMRKVEKNGTIFDQQKNTLFIKKPWYIALPWPVVNGCALAWNTGVRPGAGNMRHRCLGLKLAFMYFLPRIAKLGKGTSIGSFNEWRKGKAAWMKTLKNQLKKLKNRQHN